MKIILSLAVMTALAALEQGTTCRAAEEDGVALAIIYDTSGSMNDSVRDSTGRSVAQIHHRQPRPDGGGEADPGLRHRAVRRRAPEGPGRPVRVQRGQRAGGGQVRAV